MTKDEALQLKRGQIVYKTSMTKTLEYQVISPAREVSSEEFFISVRLGCCQRLTINKTNVEQFRLIK